MSVLANSGVRFPGTPAPTGPARVACDQESISGYSFTLQNVNKGLFGCNEEVQIIEGEFGGLIGCSAEPSDRALTCEPRGATCEFLGFNFDGTPPDDPVNPTNLYQNPVFLLAKDSEVTMFAWVKTGPASIGACTRPFETAEFQIAVRDSGGPCLTDLADKACEPPTPYHATISVAADDCPDAQAGALGLEGTVCIVDPPIECRPLRHGKVVLEAEECPLGELTIPKYEARLDGGFLSGQAGHFAFEPILRAGRYTATVESNGTICQQQTVEIPLLAQPVTIEIRSGPCL